MSESRSARFCMVRGMRRALIAAASALVLLPAASQAATYLDRPTATWVQGSGWSVTPSSSTPDAVLAQNVTQPATPATASFLTAGLGSSGYSTSVWVAKPPAFRTGETLKGVTAWAYLNTAASQTITVSLFTWFGWPLGSATVPAGSPAGWYSASAQSPVDAQSLQALGIGLKAGGTGSGSRAYAGYVEVDTNEPPPTPAGSPTTVPSDGRPSTSPGTDPTQLTPAQVGTKLASVVSVAAQDIKLSLNATSAPVTLTCAPDTPHGCQGTLVLRLIGAAKRPKATASSAGPRAVASRCARGCRPLGRAGYSIAAGRSKRVSVHLAHSARVLFRHRSSVRVQATTITKTLTRPQTSNTVITLDRAGAGSPPSSGAPGPASPGGPSGSSGASNGPCGTPSGRPVGSKPAPKPLSLRSKGPSGKSAPNRSRRGHR